MTAGVGPEALDWKDVEPTVHPGETGRAVWQTTQAGTARVRIVEYSAGYLADHWCKRGHVIQVIEGDLISEIEDGPDLVLRAGMYCFLPDQGPGHRFRSEKGAKLFIVD